MRRTTILALCLALSPLLISCSGNKSSSAMNPPPPPTGVTITPGSLTLNQGGMQAFSANVNGATDQSIFWEIAEAVPKNGDTTHGFISNAGVYLAPTAVPNPPSVTITALSAADPTKSGTSIVTIQAGSTTTVIIPQGPGRVSTFGSMQFTATVNGIANQPATWKVNGVTGGGPATGAISANGLFVAPNSVPVLTTGNNSGQTSEVVVTAVSPADPTSSDSVLVTIAPPQQNLQGANSPLGVSGSNAKDTSTTGGVTTCCGGTLGSLVSRGGNLYILSNNHVLSRSDAGVITSGQTPGDAITQPGLIDNNCAVPPTTVATLSQFFNLENGNAQTNIDAALAQITQGAIDPTGTILQLGGANNNNAPTDAPPHQGTILTSAQAVGSPHNGLVAKSGRSTGLTCSAIFAVNASFSVEYQRGCGTGTTFSASFSSQVDITNNGFSAQGDSGSLIVTQDTADPVALLFAGSTTDTVGNPISAVLNGLADPNTQSIPGFVGTNATHPVAACSLPGPQSGMTARLAVRKQMASAEALRISLAIRDAHASELMAHREVQAVGVGASYDHATEPAILLFVLAGQPRTNLPSEVDGVRTRIIEGELFPFKGALSAEESATLEQSGAPPQLVYPVSEAEFARAEKVRSAHTDEWMKRPGVQGVGIGSSVDAPGESALIIFLIKGVAHDAIPPVIDGLRTRVRESDRIRAGFGQVPPQHGCSGSVPSKSRAALAASSPQKP
jgi:hypothetical protein